MENHSEMLTHRNNYPVSLTRYTRARHTTTGTTFDEYDEEGKEIKKGVPHEMSTTDSNKNEAKATAR